MFRIESIKNEDKDDVFVSVDKMGERGNFFTIITGENGCGKSSLLSKAINTYIFDKNERSNECKTVGYSERTPSRVIAICNARYNRFTSRKTYIEESRNPYPNYYIQNENNFDVSKSLITLMQSTLREIIIESPRWKIDSQRSVDHIEGIRDAFEMIGVESRLTMSLEFDSEYIQSMKRIYSSEKSEKGFRKKYHEKIFNDHFHWRKMAGIDEYLINDFFVAYDELSKRKNSIGTMELYIDQGDYRLTDSILPRYLLLSAVVSGFLIPAKLQVQRKNSLKWVSHNSLSSGQQSMLMNAIILSTFPTKNALICIDEPENSLHPEWQLNYMTFVNALCSSNLGCHFLIATHSPQIISGLQSDNGSVVSLIDKDIVSRKKHNKYSYSGEYLTSNIQELHNASSFIRKSADQQLVDVFKSPGFGNESVIHRMLLILTKLTKKINLNMDDEKYLDRVNDLIINGKVERHDPVVVIHRQVNSIINVRAHSDN